VRQEVMQVPNLSSFAKLRAEWLRLEGLSRHHSLSVTYDYCALAAANSLASGAKIYVIKIYDDDGLALLWPLFVQRKGFVRIAYDLRCGSGADRGGPLVRHAAPAAVLGTAVSAIQQTKADIFVLDWVDEDTDLYKVIANWAQPWIIRRAPKRLLAARGSEGARRYEIKFDGFPTWEDFIATRSRSVRTGHDRRLRQLRAEQKTVEFGWCTTAEEAEHVLNWVFANKRGWAEARGIQSGTLIARDVEDLYIALARRTDLRTTPLVTFIKVDGKPIAASLNAVGAKLIEGLVMTYDQAFRRYSPGILLIHYQAKWAYETGREFDLLRHDADYKTQWANHTAVCRRHAIFLAPNSATGFAAFAGLAAHKIKEFCSHRLNSAIHIATVRRHAVPRPGA
jgi:CelD/BcsL family acetyltransferase involved in cellulose biosynthesis